MSQQTKQFLKGPQFHQDSLSKPGFMIGSCGARQYGAIQLHDHAREKQ